MDKIIRLGIAGYGRSGCDIHARYLKNDPRFKITAVADVLPERRADAAKDFSCEVFDDYTRLIENGGFDILINATPNRFHVECSLAGVKRGFHVISEKPSAPTVADFDRIIAEADASGKMFFPFQNSRFYPYFQQILKVAESGVLGKIIQARLNWSGFGRRWDWQTRQDQMAGNLFNTGPHPVDQAIVLFGSGTPDVFARMAAEHHNLGGDADNYALVVLYGPNNPTVEVLVSSLQSYPEGSLCTIQGTCGGLTATQSEVRWRWFDPATAPKQEFWKPWSRNREYCRETLDWHEEVWTYDTPQSNDDGFDIIVKGFYDDLYNVLANHAPRTITLDQVRRQVHVLEEAHRQNSLPCKPLD